MMALVQSIFDFLLPLPFFFFVNLHDLLLLQGLKLEPEVEQMLDVTSQDDAPLYF